VLGTPAAADPLVYEEEDDSFYLGVERSKSERHLYIVSQSTVSAEYRWADSADPELRFEVALPRERDHEYQLEHLDDRFVIRTNWQAPNFRLVEVPVADSADRAKWREILPHRADAFVDGFSVFRDFLKRLITGMERKIFLIVACFTDSSCQHSRCHHSTRESQK
jgi:oligopeptidase B